MDWVKEVGATGGTDGGWRNDFPLNPELPERVCIDCRRLCLPIHPMLAVRLRIFAEWHHQQGRDVNLVAPTNERAKHVFSALEIDPAEHPREEDGDAILPVTRLDDPSVVEDVAERTREILEYQLPDVSSLGQAAYMAVSELCGNAIDHGKNAMGAYAAVSRITEPRRQVSIAISDLGIGIPEHIRQQYPEWGDDGYAIAHATDLYVSGTGDPHRGVGFSEVFDAALTKSLHAARMDIHSANGFFRLHIVQQQRKPEVFPAARFRRGTSISYDLVSV